MHGIASPDCEGDLGLAAANDIGTCSAFEHQTKTRKKARLHGLGEDKEIRGG